MNSKHSKESRTPGPRWARSKRSGNSKWRKGTQVSKRNRQATSSGGGLVYNKKRDRYFPAGTVFSEDEYENNEIQAVEQNYSENSANPVAKIRRRNPVAIHDILSRREIESWAPLVNVRNVLRASVASAVVQDGPTLETSQQSMAFTELSLGNGVSEVLQAYAICSSTLASISIESVTPAACEPFRQAIGNSTSRSNIKLLWVGNSSRQASKLMVVSNMDDQLVSVYDVRASDQSFCVEGIYRNRILPTRVTSICAAVGKPIISIGEGRGFIRLLNIPEHRIQQIQPWRRSQHFEIHSQCFVDRDQTLILGAKHGGLLQCDFRENNSTVLCKPRESNLSIISSLSGLVSDENVILAHRSGGDEIFQETDRLVRLDRRKCCTASGDLAFVLGYSGHVWNHRPISRLSLDENEQLMAIIGLDKKLRIWEVSSGRLMRELKIGGQGKLACYLESPVYFCSGKRNRVLELYASILDEGVVRVSSTF